MSYSSLFLWMPLIALCLLVYTAVRRNKQYKALKPFEKLWVDYLNQTPGSPAWKVAGARLDNFIIEAMRRGADSPEELQARHKRLTTYTRISFLGEKTTFTRDSEKLAQCYEERMTELGNP